MAMSSGLSEVEISTILFSISLILEFREISIVLLAFVSEEGEDRFSCAFKVSGLITIKEDVIKIPIKKKGKKILL